MRAEILRVGVLIHAAWQRRSLNLGYIVEWNIWKCLILVKEEGPTGRIGTLDLGRKHGFFPDI